jgi:hypothetical protein
MEENRHTREAEVRGLQGRYTSDVMGTHISEKTTGNLGMRAQYRPKGSSVMRYHSQPGLLTSPVSWRWRCTEHLLLGLPGNSVRGLISNSGVSSTHATRGGNRIVEDESPGPEMARSRPFCPPACGVSLGHGQFRMDALDDEPECTASAERGGGAGSLPSGQLCDSLLRALV